MKRVILILGGWTLLSSAGAQVNVPDSLSADHRLDSLYRTLPEVLVQGERPVVRAQAGKLVYDLPRLLGGKPADNVYEAIKELPGVMENGGRLTLGGMPVTVALDGKVTTMSAEQLYALLRSMPAGRVADVEVMYQAPARYQVRGALLNVRLRQSDRKVCQGEGYARMYTKHYLKGEERVSLLFQSSRFSADLLYQHTHGRSYDRNGKEAVHTLADGTEFPLHNRTDFYSDNGYHQFRLGADWNLGKDHRISLVYNGSYDGYDRTACTVGTLRSETVTEGHSWLHNGRLDYQTPLGLKAGAEFTWHNSPSEQLVYSTLNGVRTDFRSRDDQRISRLRLFLSGEHRLGQGWEINYGIIHTNSLDHSFQYYVPAEEGEATAPLPDDLRSRLREETLNLYGGFSKAFGRKWSLDLSLAAERYHTAVWDQWDWYPTLNLQFRPSGNHILQFALSSDKRFPSYWAVQNGVSYSGGSYSEIQGNPWLKPAQSYQAELRWILRGKYIFRAWYGFIDDYMTQQQYQMPDRLAEAIRYLNFNDHRQAGLMASLPVRPFRWWSARLNLIGVWMRERDDDYFDLSFDRSICYGMLSTSHTFTLSPQVTFSLSGMIRSKAQQGLMDLPSSGNLDVDLNIRLSEGRWNLRLYGKDLLETAAISPRIRYATQNLTNSYPQWRECGVSLTYRFGGYKEKAREAVDTSRFK